MPPLVSLQINLAPVDYPYARAIIPHQLEVLAEQCSEVVFVIDLHRSRGRFGGRYWVTNRDRLAALIETLKHAFPTVSFKEHTVEYSKSVRRQVSGYSWQMAAPLATDQIYRAASLRPDCPGGAPIR